MRAQLSSAVIASLVALGNELNEQPGQIPQRTAIFAERLHSMLCADRTLTWVASGTASAMGDVCKRLSAYAPQSLKIKRSNEFCVLRSFLFYPGETTAAEDRTKSPRIEVAGGGLIVGMGRIHATSQVVCVTAARDGVCRAFAAKDLSIVHLVLGYLLESVLTDPPDRAGNLGDR